MIHESNIMFTASIIYPQGSIVWANVWYYNSEFNRETYYYSFGPRAILHDEKIFPEPFKFRPERYLTADNEANSTVAAAFGFGRR